MAWRKSRLSMSLFRSEAVEDQMRSPQSAAVIRNDTLPAHKRPDAHTLSAVDRATPCASKTVRKPQKRCAMTKKTPSA